MISSGIILFLFFAGYVFVIYKAIVHRRLYWYAPTIIGFKKRKKDISSRDGAFFIAIFLLPWGVFIGYIFFRYVMALIGE
jgi:hypothetical protein